MRSSRHSRLSVAIELFIARINMAGPPEKRPPHIGLELPVRLILLLLCALVAGCDKQNAEQQQGTEAAAGPVAGLDRSHKGKAAPEIEILGPDAEPASFADLTGKPTLVNLWATWCAPCVKELPTLNALAKSGRVRVVAISQDTGPHASVEAFLDYVKADELEAFQDPKLALSGALGVQVLPTSILFDAEGREVWRFVGDRDWSSAEVEPLLAEGR